MHSLKAPKTATGYESNMADFMKTCDKTYLDEIGLGDLITYRDAMVEDDLEPGTIDTRLTYTGVFLHPHDVLAYPNLTILREGKRVPLSLSCDVDLKQVAAYTEQELRTLFNDSTEEEREIWEVLRQTGLRKGEFAHLEYSDILFRENAIRVQAKPQYDWKPKSKKGTRNVPIPDSLLALLTRRQLAHPNTTLIFPDAQGQPTKGCRFLLMLKERAFHAGLNGGTCVGRRDGKEVSCAEGAYCSYWKLHRFRATFATDHYYNQSYATIGVVLIARLLAVHTPWGRSNRSRRFTPPCSLRREE